MCRNGVAYLAHVALLNDCVRKRTFSKPSTLPALTGERERRAGIAGGRPQSMRLERFFFRKNLETVICGEFNKPQFCQLRYASCTHSRGTSLCADMKHRSWWS